MACGQRRAAQQLLVDLHLFADAQAVRHLHDVDAVEEGLVVLVVAEGLPLALVAVREHDAVEGDGAEAFGALVVAFLRGGQQRVQHLDRRLEHFHELEQALVGAGTGRRSSCRRPGRPARRSRACGCRPCRPASWMSWLFSSPGSVLAMPTCLSTRRVALDDLELADVAAVLVEALHRPRRQDALQVAARDAVLALEDRAVFDGIEQARAASRSPASP